MPILAPFEAFARDAMVLDVETDESRLPVKWLAAAQVAARLADSRAHERKALLRTWVQQQAEDGKDGVWSALSVPGIPVRDLASASAALCHIAADMERGGALNLAYSTVTHMRISMLERGPAKARAAATLQQARVLRQMGLLEEASDTYQEAREDAVRAGDTDIEGRAFIGEAAVAGHRGNYPEAEQLALRGLRLLPERSSAIPHAHMSLMLCANKLGRFADALEHGWKGYDAAAANPEQRAGLVSNMSSLALRMGKLSAARRGFVATLGMTDLERIVFPSLGGLALTCAAARDTPALTRAAATFARVSASSTLPYEFARASIEFAQAWKEIGELDKAAEYLAGARELAGTHGFHEVSMNSDLLADALATSQHQAAPDSRVDRAIARFDELPAEDSALTRA